MGESSTELFSRNAPLFTVLGVFGAISVYFTQLETQSRWQRLGVVSSLTIFILIAVTIQRNVPPTSSDKNPFDFVTKQPWRRKFHVVFYIAFYAVVASVIGIVMQFTNTIVFLIQFLCLIFAISITMWLVGLAETDDLTVEIGRDPRTIIYFSYLLRNAVYAVSIGSGGLLLLWVSNNIPVTQLAKFQMSSFSLAVLIGFLSGLTIGGALYSFIFSSAMVTHVFLRKLRREDSLEAFDKFYQQSFLSGWDGD